MTNEEILNIVKLKYSEARISEEGRIIIGESGGGYKEINGVVKFIAEAIICIENNKIIFYHRKNNFLGYIECKSDVEYEFKNIIELKHILKLEITRDDIVNYLEKELYSSYVDADGIGGWEIKRTAEYDNLIVEEYKQDGNFKLLLYEEDEDGYNCSTISIFNASNSNEYWKLYNIINNLIKE